MKKEEKIKKLEIDSRDCPKCGERMELKFEISPGEDDYSAYDCYQCPSCKNIEGI